MIAAQESPRGPLYVPQQYPLSALHLSFPPQRADLLREEGLEIDLAGSWSSVCIDEDSYRVDGETVSPALRISYGIKDDLQAGVYLPFVWRGAGALDGVIDSWHEAFDLPNGDRGRLPEDDFEIYSLGEDSESFEIDEGGWAPGNMVLSSRYSLAVRDQDGFDLSLGGDLALPTAAAQFGARGVDGALSLLMARSWGRSSLHAGAAVIGFSDDDVSGVRFRRFHLEEFVGYEYAFSGMSLLVSLHGSSRTVRGIEGHPSYAIYLDTGVRIDLAQGTDLAVFLRENPAPQHGTTDVTFIIGLTFTNFISQAGSGNFSL